MRQGININETASQRKKILVNKRLKNVDRQKSNICKKKEVTGKQLKK